MKSILEDESPTVFDFLTMLKRRRHLFWAPVLGIAVITLYLAISPPSYYVSKATILIEDQEISAKLVGATIGNYASQQIQLISQRLLTIKNIEAIVEKFDVYGLSSSKKAVPPARVAAWFREDLQLDLVSTDVLDSRSRSGEAAIAFTIAFTSTDPETAQSVTNELVTLFLSENQRSTASRSSDVSALLRQSLDAASDELLVAEAALADFKSRNEGALPELHEHNLNAIARAEDQLSGVNLRIQELDQRKLQLSAQLAPLSPTASVILPTGETIMSDRERLRALQAEFRRKAASYQPGHPDLVQLEREIDQLRSSVGNAVSREVLEEQLRLERERQDILLERYSADHPDVKSSAASVSALESQLSALGSQSADDNRVADNPAYVLVNTQLQSTELELQSQRQKRNELQARIARLEGLLEKAPRVEMEYGGLLRTYENARTNYNDLQGKLHAAEVAKNVDIEIIGQRFTLLEKPALPLSPEGPNRLAIVVIGLLLAAGAGAGSLLIAEILDNSIHSVKRLAEVAGAAPLAVIPYLDNSEDVAASKSQRIYVTAAVLAGTVLCITIAHYVTITFF